MVGNCSAYGCKTGYKSQVRQPGEERLSLHSFPLNDPNLLEKWIKANPRKDFMPTKHSKLCSLHFQERDFIEQSQDTNKWRKKPPGNEKLQNRYLKEGVIPSVFPNAPKYVSSKGTTPRTTKMATSSSRRMQEENAIEDLNQSFIAEDDLSHATLSEIAEKLKKETTAPVGFQVTEIDDRLLIYYIAVKEDIPRVASSITIRPGSSVVVILDNKVVPSSQYYDLIKCRLTKMSQLVNLMVRLKNWQAEPTERSSQLLLELALKCLRCALGSFDDIECEQYNKIFFIVEQLDLLQKNKHGRLYSPQLIIFSYLVFASSPAAYEVLREEKLLCLPSTTTLRKVTRRLSHSDGLNNRAYLLNQFEQNVLLMIDILLNELNIAEESLKV